MQSFLPEPEALPQPPQRSGKKVLALWVVLILMFLGIWQFLTPSQRPADEAALPPLPECAPSSSSSALWIGMAAPLAVAALIVFFFLRAYRQNDAFNLAQEPGRLAAAEGRFADAVALFQGTFARFAKQPAYRAIAVLNAASAQLRASRLEDALASYASVERSRTMLLGSGVRTVLATETALILALQGDVAGAERWVAEARTRISKNRDDRLGHAGRLAIAEAILLCRKSDHADATRLLDTHWREMRYALTSDTVRGAEVVRAFAEAQQGVRAANALGERLVRIEPVTKGEFDFLGAAWPEMHTFLAAHDLAAATS